MDCANQVSISTLGAAISKIAYPRVPCATEASGQDGPLQAQVLYNSVYVASVCIDNGPWPLLLYPQI